MTHEKKLMCRILGHNIKGQPIKPVGSTMGRKMTDEHGNPLYPPVAIAYHMRECKRCGRRQPLTPEDAAEQARINTEINKVMNGSRKQYGLGWIDFSVGP